VSDTPVNIGGVPGPFSYQSTVPHASHFVAVPAVVADHLRALVRDVRGDGGHHSNWYLLALNAAAGQIQTILSWMPHVKVLAPRQLRDRVRRRMRLGLARCG